MYRNTSWKKSEKTSNMLKMSHHRDREKIWQLKQDKTWLESQVWELNQTIDKQSKTLKRWFAEWRKLNTRVWELETEKSYLNTVISQIEAELARKKRRLKWETLSEKLNWFLGFTREIQTQKKLDGNKLLYCNKILIKLKITWMRDTRFKNIFRKS